VVQPGVAPQGDATYNLSGGLAAGARFQIPLLRQVGLLAGADITRRHRRGEREGDPIALNEKVTLTRLEAGLGFRFRPSAPVFFGAVFVYDRLNPGAGPFQDLTVSESGGGFGVGVDFGRSTQHRFFGRLDVWNYWLKPSATGLDVGYETKNLAHDLSISLSVHYRIPKGFLGRRR
jgi:hypothetical protein